MVKTVNVASTLDLSEENTDKQQLGGEFCGSPDARQWSLAQQFHDSVMSLKREEWGAGLGSSHSSSSPLWIQIILGVRGGELSDQQVPAQSPLCPPQPPPHLWRETSQCESPPPKQAECLLWSSADQKEQQWKQPFLLLFLENLKNKRTTFKLSWRRLWAIYGCESGRIPWQPYELWDHSNHFLHHPSNLPHLHPPFIGGFFI